jgi:serine O-acetyltransferase
VSVRELLRADLARYRAYNPGTSAPKLVFENQGLWAIAEYRVGHAIKTHPSPSAGLRILRVVWGLVHKVVETVTGISISHSARIGPGLYVGHFGGIIVGGGVELGAQCNIAQGVTLGTDGAAENPGSPRIGDDVHIAPGAVIFGPIEVGSHSKIGANSVVTRSVPANVLAAGMPAEVKKHYD